MKAGWRAALAGGIWLLALLLAVTSIALNLMFPAVWADPAGPSALAVALLFLPALLAFPLVGGLVARRRPEHLIGWLFLVVGLALGVVLLAPIYAWYALVEQPGTLPAPAFAVLMINPAFAVGLTAGLLAILVFPDGRLPSPRWRFAPALVILASLLGTLVWTLQPGPFDVPAPVVIDNPVGLAGAEPVLAVVQDIGDVLDFAAFVSVALAVGVRFRRSQGVQRQQLKWLLYATAFMALAFVITFTGYGLGLPEATVNLLWGFGFLGFGLLPVAVGIAILRYRLYDIDLVIRRTLVYGGLTAALGLTYWGLVALMQQLLRPFTEGSEPAIIASTLAVAALFQPARRRIQDTVDRRFYRSKYDARRTLETFSARLRAQTDLDSLSRELVGVVQQTVQPAKVSLWLRPTPRGRRA